MMMMKMTRMETLGALGSERVGAGLQEWEGPEGRYLKEQYTLRVLRSSSAAQVLTPESDTRHRFRSAPVRLYLSGRHDVTVTGGGEAKQCRPVDAQNMAVWKHGRVCDSKRWWWVEPTPATSRWGTGDSTPLGNRTHNLAAAKPRRQLIRCVSFNCYAVTRPRPRPL